MNNLSFLDYRWNFLRKQQDAAHMKNEFSSSLLSTGMMLLSALFRPITVPLNTKTTKPLEWLLKIFWIRDSSKKYAFLLNLIILPKLLKILNWFQWSPPSIKHHPKCRMHSAAQSNHIPTGIQPNTAMLLVITLSIRNSTIFLQIWHPFPLKNVILRWWLFSNDSICIIKNSRNSVKIF